MVHAYVAPGMARVEAVPVAFAQDGAAAMEASGAGSTPTLVLSWGVTAV